jgi:acyl carrier protein
MTIREVIYHQIKLVAEQQRKSLPVLKDDMVMLETGLDSLCFAIIIANLDDELNLNPLDQNDVRIPVTFGDLIRVYEQAAGQHVGG